MSRDNSGGWSVASLLWATAYLALGIQASLPPAGLETALGLVFLGHGLWVLSLLLGERDRARDGNRLGAGLVYGSLAAAGLVELWSAAICWRVGDQNLACYFAIAASFAGVGILTTRQREPDDGQFVGQLIFHVPLLLPTLAIPIGSLVLRGTPGSGAAGVAGSLVPLIRPWIVVLGVVLPVAITTQLAILGYWIATRRESDQAGWSAILAHQSAWMFLLIRWTAEHF